MRLIIEADSVFELRDIIRGLASPIATESPVLSGGERVTVPLGAESNHLALCVCGWKAYFPTDDHAIWATRHHRASCEKWIYAPHPEPV